MTSTRIAPKILQGAFDSLPLVIAAIPFGLIFGALSISSGLSPLATVSMSLFVFAGSSQFIAVILLSSSAALPVILLAVFFVNLRHTLYAITLMPQFKKLPQKLRFPMAFLLTDETFAVVSNKVSKNPDLSEIHLYYLGSAFSMYFVWGICTVVGIVLGQHIPNVTNWGLDVAMILAFVGIVVPKLKARSEWACAVVALFSTLLTFQWPHQIGLLFSSILAICVGVFFEVEK